MYYSWLFFYSYLLHRQHHRHSFFTSLYSKNNGDIKSNKNKNISGCDNRYLTNSPPETYKSIYENNEKLKELQALLLLNHHRHYLHPQPLFCPCVPTFNLPTDDF